MMFILSPTHKRWGIVVFILSLLGSIVELLGVSIILPFAQAMIDPDKLRQNTYISSVCDHLNIVSNQGMIILLTCIVILIYLFKNLYLGFLAWVRIRYSTKVQRELSIRMLRSYIQRGYVFFRMTNNSVLSRGCGSSISSIQNIISCFFRIVTDILTLVCIFVFIAYTDLWMAIAMMLLSCVALLLMMVVFRQSVKKAGREYFEKIGVTNKWLYQLFNGIKEITVMHKENFFLQNYNDAYYDQQKASITQNLAQTYPTYFIESLCITGIMATVCWRILSMSNPSAYMVQLAAFAVAAFRTLPSIGRISSTFSYFLFQIPSANEVYENMKEAEQYAESNQVSLGQSKDISNSKDNHSNHVFSESLTLENISFTYPDGQEKVLNNINLTINHGDSIAFVGPSGAGKSTLADIILGLYELEAGTIKMDGIDLLNNPEMRAINIGFVPQSVYLMDDTVRRNIAFGHLDSEIEDEKVWTSLEQSQMKSYIESLPDGLDTLVGERGVRFSGGQAQRLAIARALYNDPQILILDEATSALDNDTEHAIMDAINSLQGYKTLIIIAHRLTTVKNCDHIYEIKNQSLTEKRYSDLQ